MEKKRKKFSVFFLLTLIFGVILLVGLKVFDQYEKYERTIVQVTDVVEGKQTDLSDEHGNPDREYKQKIKGKIMNGSHKSRIIDLKNTYSFSKVYDYPYRKGDLLFVSLKEKTKGRLQGSIVGFKRDKQVGFLMIIFLLLLVCVGQKQGFSSIFSLILNTVLLSFIVTLFVESNSINLILYFGVATVLFTIFSLFFVGGKSDKTLAAIIATLLGTFVSFGIAFIVIKLLNHGGLRYEEMEFVTRPPQDIFLAGLLVGCLGAVMDVAITIVSAMEELYAKNPSITKEELKKSGMTIGQDVMGPMANVLLFAYVSGALPVLILYLRNSMSLQFSLSMLLSLELARALVGSIGIVMTVPISIYISLSMVERRRGRKV